MSGVIEWLAVVFIVSFVAALGRRSADPAVRIVKQWRDGLRTSEKWMKRWFMVRYPWNIERRGTAEFDWGWNNLK